MMTPANFRIVDGAGRVHHAGLTSAQCDAFLSIMVGDGRYAGLRSEPMTAAPITQAAQGVPHIVAELRAADLVDIEPGQERDALRQAIEARKDAAERLADARQAVERAAAFRDARKAEHAAMATAHEAEIRSSAGDLARALMAGGPVSTRRVIDRSALADSETRLVEAEQALRQLEAERAAADAVDRSAETYHRLAVMAVKRSHAAEMVQILNFYKSQIMTFAAMIEAGRFCDVPVTLEAQEALHIPAPDVAAIDAAAQRWHAITAALRQDADAVIGVNE